MGQAFTCTPVPSYFKERGPMHLNDAPNVTFISIMSSVFKEQPIKSYVLLQISNYFLKSLFFFFNLENELNRPNNLKGLFESWETITMSSIRHQTYLSKINIVARHCFSHYSIMILLFIEFICYSRVSGWLKSLLREL